MVNPVVYEVDRFACGMATTAAWNLCRFCNRHIILARRCTSICHNIRFLVHHNDKCNYFILQRSFQLSVFLLYLVGCFFAIYPIRGKGNQWISLRCFVWMIETSSLVVTTKLAWRRWYTNTIFDMETFPETRCWFAGTPRLRAKRGDQMTSSSLCLFFKDILFIIAFSGL